MTAQNNLLSMPQLTRQHYAQQIICRLQKLQPELISAFAESGRRYFCVDDLLDEQHALALYAAFPQPKTMRRRKSLREDKYVAAQMNSYATCLEEALYAFQQPELIELIAEITGIQALRPDPELYASGLSVMAQGQFLNPHLDNSHDINKQDYRVINLLYYVTPDWPEALGGSLELWDENVTRPLHTIDCRFNRLVIMATDEQSYHSVSPILHNGNRCCISNYYFSRNSPSNDHYFHVTSFRGRPEQSLRDWLLRNDSRLRMTLRRIFKKKIFRQWHYYRKDR